MIERINVDTGPEGLEIFTTTAAKGVNFDRFNSRSAVYYSQLKREIAPAKLVTMYQKHGAQVVRVHKMSCMNIDCVSCDGLFTTDRELALGVLTADCFPVIIAGNFSFSALHCGWRGTVAGIIQNAVALFKTVEDIPRYAYVGPGISRKNFEVKKDFINELSRYMDPFPYLYEEFDRFHFDLQEFIIMLLVKLGVSVVEHFPVCTYDSPDLHSYRRDGFDSGRMITVARFIS